jgi:hypothetical protein
VKGARRRFLVVGALLLVLGGGALSLIPAFAIRRQFEVGKDHLIRAQASLLAGDLDAAAASFASARTAFQDAAGHPGRFLLRLEGYVPFLGRTPDALLSLATIGETVAGAGEDVARDLAALPQGLSSLGLRDGRIPIEELRALAPAVRRARIALDGAAERAARLPDAWVLGPVAEARDLVRSRLAEAVPLAHSADALLSALPAFAGEDGPKRYFVAVENSAELRGTGGLIGNYSILTLDRGRLSLSPFRDTESLANVPASSVPSPSPEFSQLYGPFGGGGFWLNINMTPDAPTAAGLIESLYERVEGESLDGTILFDLQGLAKMLQITGPVGVHPLGVTVDSKSVLGYVATAAYLDSGIANPFSRGPRLIADAIWGRFLSGTEPDRALRSLVEMAAGGHLVLHSADPGLQAAFSDAGVAGEFRAGPGDFLGVVINNAAANKVDYYLGEEVRYVVAVGPEGTATATATVLLENDAPAGRPPSYPLGPSDAARESGLDLVPGENRSWAAVYCPSRCRLASIRGSGDVLLEEHREQGLTVFAGFVQIEPQSSTELRLVLDLEGVWDGDRTGGVYRLRLQGQPMARPALISLEVRAPDGMAVVWTNVPMDVDGERATWRGRLGPRDDLVVRFTKPLAARVWTRVWDFLSTPVIRL